MLTLTPAATKYLQENLESSPDGTLGIRLGLRDAGCSGFAYTFDFATSKNENDQIYSFGEILIFVDAKFSKALYGMEIDYVTQGVNSLLQFNNPNVVNSCGCGESFQFKDDSTA